MAESTTSRKSKPCLLSMFRTFSDVQTADMLHFAASRDSRRKAAYRRGPSSPELKELVGELVKRAQRIRSGGVDPKKDNMLKVTGDGRKAALDMRIINPVAEIEGVTKLRRAVDEIYRIWEEGNDKRTTQLVFCDLSTPNADRFNVYDEIRDRLIERGIPPKEIAYIHDAETDTQKKALFDSVNAGRVRILLGSTEKMGAGTNVQKRLIALHHLDAPWRPRDIEQREGRILRQGNANPEVHIHRYVTEGSFDAYMWQCLENKARFINQVMNGSVTVRQTEDLEGGALTYAEIKAIASGNPAVMEKVKVDTEVRKLDQLRASHINQQHNIRWKIKSLPEYIERAQKYHAAISADILTRDGHAEEDFVMKRLAALRTLFEYVAQRFPDRLGQAQKAAAIPRKRAQPPETIFLERDGIEGTLARLPADGRNALRDRTLLLFLYNTGARVQEAADLRASDIHFTPTPRAHLHGKGDKWRICPLWEETATLLNKLTTLSGSTSTLDRPVFTGTTDAALTRFGIYKIIRRYTTQIIKKRADGQLRPISPHIWRHSTAVHLLESGVEVNVICAWLGHASLETTNRYAEITLRTKRTALEKCALPTVTGDRIPRKPAWQTDDALLHWLQSL